MPKKARQKLSDRDIFQKARIYVARKAEEAAAKKEATEAQQAIVAELVARGVKSMQDTDALKVTLVQSESVVYNSDGIWSALKPKQRRKCFRENINLNALAPDARKRVYEALTREERKAVTSYTLNVDALAVEVQKGNISAAVVSEHSDIKYGSPYIRVSKGSG